MARLILNPERERSLLRRHPWLFESAVACIIRQLSGSADHPVGMAFPECKYLKG